MKLICLSGGAIGSDNLFAKIGLEMDYVTYNMSFRGHNCCKEGIRINLSKEELNSRLKDYEEICKRLNRKISNNEYIRNLQLRNSYQIKGKKKTTDLVIAIGSINNNNTVDGGTGYAVEYAKMNKVPIIILEKTNLKFYFFNYSLGIFDLLTLNKLKEMIHKKEEFFFTGIGSRNINASDCLPRIKKLINFLKSN